MNFEIIFKNQVLEDLARIPRDDRERIFKKAETWLIRDPFPHGKNPKRLKGNYGFRLRMGNYRILYEIAGNKVIIYAIDDRKKVYKHFD